MKNFLLTVSVLILFGLGIALGMYAERQRPIPTSEVRFDPDTMSFLRDQ